MAILIITNRNIRRYNDHRAFGDDFNRKGPMELRLAHANKKKNGKWRVDIVSEQVKSLANLPSMREFDSFRENMIGRSCNCVFYVHGVTFFRSG